MSTRLEELFVELKLKAGDYLNEVAKVQRETEALARQSGAGANNAGQLGKTLGQLGNQADKGRDGVGKITNSLSSMAIQAVGLQGPLGKLSEGLLLFAAGSATATAIAAGIALIGAAMRALKEDTVDTDAAVKELLTTFKQETGQDVFDKITAAQTRLAELIKKRDELSTSTNISRTADKPNFIAEAAAAEFGLTQPELLAAARKEVKDTTKELNELNEAIGLEEAKLKDFLRGIADAGPGAAGDTSKQAEALQDRIRTAAAAANRGLAELTGDPFKAKLAELNAQIAAVKDTQADLGKDAPPALAEYIKKLEEASAITKQLQESTERTLETAQSLADPMGFDDPRRVPAILQGGRTFGGPNQEGTNPERVKLKLLQQQQDVLVAQADQVNRAVEGALQLGVAFGVVGDQVGAILIGISQVATAIPGLLKGISILQAGGGPLGIISAGLSIVGGLASIASQLFGGDSVEDRARRETIQKNTEALDRVRSGLEQFGGDFSGNQLQRARFLALGAVSRLNQPGAWSNLSPEQAVIGTGISLRELRDIADEFGVTLDGTKESWTALNNAIASQDLTAFTKTFAGQRGALDLQAALFDQTDQERLAALAAAAAKASPNALGGLAGLDLTTAAGRAAAEQLLQDIFARERAGTLTGLGDVSLNQLNDLLRDLEGLIDTVNEQGRVGGTTEQFGIAQTITVAQASQITAFLSTANVWAQETAENTGALVDLVAQAVAKLTGEAVVPLSSRAMGDSAASRALDLGNNRAA